MSQFLGVRNYLTMSRKQKSHEKNVSRKLPKANSAECQKLKGLITDKMKFFQFS